MKIKRKRFKRIDEQVIIFQRKVADYLNSKVNGLTRQVKKLAFVSLGIMIALLCFQLIIQSLIGEKVDVLDTIDQLTLPHEIQPKNLTKDSTLASKKQQKATNN